MAFGSLDRRRYRGKAGQDNGMVGQWDSGTVGHDSVVGQQQCLPQVHPWIPGTLVNGNVTIIIKMLVRVLVAFPCLLTRNLLVKKHACGSHPFPNWIHTLLVYWARLKRT